MCVCVCVCVCVVCVCVCVKSVCARARLCYIYTGRRRYACYRIDDQDLFIADSDDVVAIKRRLGLEGADYRRSVQPQEDRAPAYPSRAPASFGSHGFQLPVPPAR